MEDEYEQVIRMLVSIMTNSEHASQHARRHCGHAAGSAGETKDGSNTLALPSPMSKSSTASVVLGEKARMALRQVP